MQVASTPRTAGLPVDPQIDDAMQQCVTVNHDADILGAELGQAVRDGLTELPTRGTWGDLPVVVVPPGTLYAIPWRCLPPSAFRLPRPRRSDPAATALSLVTLGRPGLYFPADNRSGSTPQLSRARSESMLCQA